MSQLTRYILIPALVGSVVGLIIMSVYRTGSDKPGYAAAVTAAAAQVAALYIGRMGKFQDDTLWQQATQAFQAGNLPQAQANCEKLLRRDSRNVNAIEMLGRVALAQGFMEKAASHVTTYASRPSPSLMRSRTSKFWAMPAVSRFCPNNAGVSPSLKHPNEVQASVIIPLSDSP